MLPTPKSAHVDSALTNISILHKNQNYVAERVFQNVTVPKQSDYYYIFRKGAWFRNEARVRGPGAKAARGGYPITSTTYRCDEYAFGHPVPIELINNADDVLDPMGTGAKFATDKILLAKEVLMSTLCMTAANWTTTDDVAAAWVKDTDGSTNTFIADILTQRQVIRKLIGVMPNVLLMDSKTFDQIKQTYSVLERIKYTGTQGRPADVTPSTIAQLFELDEVIIGGSIYSSAEEVMAGTDFTAVDLWETNATKGAALLYYRPPAPSIETPAAGYIFNWKGDAGAANTKISSGPYRTVRKYWEDAEKQWIVEASEYFDPVVTCADAGCLFYDTIVT